ncbi:MAG: ATP-dependent helicase [Bacteroidales bacterium]|nr:ATP-dependent helicase [Lachnoclostridium sp.]MCM1383066.1 ATP-dependent helicase [Lachnoclostridium sp.]MCM1463879.1 ATP-dependent helicase [Bacteroidales bacterium]
MLDLPAMNEAQQDAVTHGEGPLLVLAGPGSGKTFVITQRIFYLLQKLHIPPEEILVITFTKAAALSMQNRFREQSDQIYPVNFGTFHSCFYHILRESHVLDNYKIVTEAEKRSIVSKLPVLTSNPTLNPEKADNNTCETIYGHNKVNTFSGCESSNRGTTKNETTEYKSTEVAAQFLQAFSFYKNTYDEQGAKKKLPMEYQEAFQSVFQAYEQERKRRRLLDFDDMVYQCHKLLTEDDSLRSYWQNRFSHILMDEFQDINPMQYEVVKLLAGAKTQLFAVGDDDQSIYGFRGSKPACLKQFQEEFKAEDVYLSINYRSTPEIVNASLQVISKNEKRFDKKLISAQRISHIPEKSDSLDEKMSAEGFKNTYEKEGEVKLKVCGNPGKMWKTSISENTDEKSENGGVSLKSFEEREEQYDYLAQKLGSFIKPQESVGILFRTNSYMQGFAAKLSRMGIPYDMKEKITNIYDHFIVKDIMAYLRLAEREGEREHLLRILNKPVRYLSRESLGEQISEKLGCGQRVNMAFRGTVQEDLLERMLNYYRNAQNIPYRKERLSAIEKLKRDLIIMEKRPLYLKVQYILKGIGYEKYLKDSAGANTEKWQEYQEILEWLGAESKECTTLSEWLDAKETYEKSLRKMPEQPSSEQIKIHLMTVHASKGLEFDHVWIPDCNEKVFPHGNMPDAVSCEEERRIFYVAMTRAKKSLELLYLTGTKERPRLPSRFLNPLLHSSTNSSNSHLSKYSSNASETLSYSSSSSM